MQTSNVDSNPRHRCCLLFFVLFSLWLLPSTQSLAYASTHSLSSAQEFWTQSAEEQAIEKDITLDFIVRFYDPDWKLLWGVEDQGRFFLKVAGQPLPIKPGQHVRIRGRIDLEKGLVSQPSMVEQLREIPPPPPIPASDQLNRPSFLEQQFVQVSGFVDELTHPDPKHTSLGLIVNGSPVNIQVLGTIPDDMLGARITVSGLLALERIGALPMHTNIWVSGPEAITRIGWVRDDPSFALPPTPASLVSETLPKTPIHVKGFVKLQKPGTELWIADESGEILVESPQRTHLEPGTPVQAIGLPSSRGNKPALVQASFLSSDALPPDPTHTITGFKDWFNLPGAERLRDWIVDTIVRVRYYDPYWKMLWVEDSTGCYFLNTTNATFSFGTGQLLRIQGLYSEARGLRAKQGGIQVLESRPPPTPPDQSDSVADFARHDTTLVSLTGYVDRQSFVDVNHDRLELIVNGIRITATTMHAIGQEYIRVQGAIIRLSGLYSYDPKSKLFSPGISLLCESPSQLQFLHWLRSDPEFQLPVTSVDKLGSLPNQSRIHVAGSVHKSQRGSHVDIRDKTGQLRIFSTQDEGLRDGEFIEAIGSLENNGLQLRLQKGLFLRTAQSLNDLPGEDSNQAILMVGQVSELSAVQAARKYPVRITGQCTWAAQGMHYFYCQDSSGSIKVLLPETGAQAPTLGDLLQIVGETQASAQDPQIIAHTVRVLRSNTLPTPAFLTLDQARSGTGANELISLNALLRGFKREGNFYQLDYLCSAGPFKGLLPATENPAPFVGAIVQARGLNLVTKERLRTPEVQLLQNSINDISLIEPKPANLDRIPVITLASLSLNPPRPGFERLVRVRGVVTLHQPGSHLYIEEGSEAMRILSSSLFPVQPGELIEAAGLPVWQGSHLVLQDASYVLTGQHLTNKPIIVKDPYSPQADFDGFLVTMEGTLLDTTDNLADLGSFSLQNGTQHFVCTLVSNHKQPALELKRGTRIAVTGIYHLALDDNHAPSSFSVELRSPADIHILALPTWWTAEHALTVVGALAALLGLTAGWILLLRQKVRQQTDIIRTQMEKQAQLMTEIERSARLESLGLLAGGIAHDFNNMLTVVAGNITLARMEDGVEQVAGTYLDEAEQGALRARSLTQQLLTFARGGNPMRKPEALLDFIKDEMRKTLGHSKVQFSLQAPPDLWRGFVDKAQLAQILAHLTNNALQAMPAGGTLTVSLANQEIRADTESLIPSGRYLRITFSDTGEGITKDNLSKIFDPYFSTRQGHRGLGLSLVRSIVKKHEGHLSVESYPGAGTTFSLWLPAANESASSIEENKVPAKAHASPCNMERPRLLFMDDEAPIRLIASALFRKLGYEATLVSDGEQAVAEYRNALAKGRPFHLLIFDLAVPEGMGGKEALAQIHAFDPKALAMVSSGYSNDPVMAAPRSHGFAAVLPKPYQVDDLARAVDTLLGFEHKSISFTKNPVPLK